MYALLSAAHQYNSYDLVSTASRFTVPHSVPMLTVKLEEVDWEDSSSEENSSEPIASELATEDNHAVLAAVDVNGNRDKDQPTTETVADPSGAPQLAALPAKRSLDTSSNETLPAKRSLDIKSAKGSVGLVSGNPSLVRGFKRFRSLATSKPPAMAPPPPPRANRGQDKVNQHSARKIDSSFAWHFGGKRRWAWMHDGITPNGWIELCDNGALCTNLCPSGEGSWKQQHNSDNLLVIFGKCCHVLELQITRPSNEPVQYNSEPTFIVRKRIMVNGQPLRDRRPCRTRGRLLIPKDGRIIPYSKAA